VTASSAPVAVVTGAMQGIGRRVAEALADEGYALALIDLREPVEVLAAVRDRGVEALGVTGDVAAEADVAALAGSIVNVASIAGLRGVADRAAYNASKHGLVGLTRTLAAEWGGRGVRVNAVCPGWVKTEMDAADQAAGGYSDADIVGQVPMGRFAVPGDVAAVVAFLADPERSGFVNGVALPVDGGWTADAGWTALRLRKRAGTTD
jgi:NAD(P)-dependent dehydrogenase (short-subunit alcohol dehydrogenase family)